jgi:DNA-directed RNA polymerase I, II, and III subunit RPABC1
MDVVRRNIQRMFDDRGYAPTEASEMFVPPSLKGIIENPGGSGPHMLLLQAHVLGVDGGAKQCYAIAIANNEKISVKVARDVIEAFKEEAIHALIIVADGITPFARKEIILSPVQHDVHMFTEPELMYNPMDNDSTPPHEKCSAEEVAALIERFGPLRNYPMLPKSDRIARHYGFAINDVIRIKRNWGNVREVVYRVVVKE